MTDIIRTGYNHQLSSQSATNEYILDVSYSRIAEHPLMRVSAYLFMFQYFIQLVTLGDQGIYRIAQAIWLVLAFFTIFYFWKSTSRPSKVFLMFLFVMFFASIASGFRILVGDEDSSHPFLRLATLVVYLWYFDAFRFLGLQYFMSRFSKIATVMIGISAFHMLMSPEIVFGRYLFFGQHPNLGGEILFACFLCVAFSNRLFGLVLLSATVFYLLFLLQARAAFVATAVTLFVYLISSIKFSKIFFVYATFLCIFVLASIPLIAFGMDFSIADIVYFTLNDILMLNDPMRGISSGISGRDETWAVGFELFSLNPLFGAGIDNAIIEDSGVRVHSGPVLLLAEFGMLSLVLFGILFAGLNHLFKFNLVGFSALLGCIVAFLFQARGLNTNIFPLLMWVLCLPWVKQAMHKVVR